MTAVRRRSVHANRLLEFPDIVLLDGAEFSRRGRWREHFASRIGPAFDGRVIFEVGCNDASFLTTIAAKHPATAFVGIDWKCRALHTAAERIASANLKNVALLHGRAQDLLRFFADGELDELWVFHPDPCDRPRELPNRLLSESFLGDAHRALRPGSSLVLKTDHRGYYEATVQIEGDFDLIASSTDFWGDPKLREVTATKCFAGESTAYEAQFRRKRKPIYYLELRKGVIPPRS